MWVSQAKQKPPHGKFVSPSLSLTSTLRTINSRRCLHQGGTAFNCVYMKIRFGHTIERSLSGTRTATFVTPHIPETPSCLAENQVQSLPSRQRSAAVDARHTHTQFLVHALAVNIDMVCELSAALVCLCKNCIKVCAKNLRIYFLLLRFLWLPIVIIMRRDSNVVVAIAKIFNNFLCCVLARGTEFFSDSWGIGADETHVSGDNFGRCRMRLF